MYLYCDLLTRKVIDLDVPIECENGLRYVEVPVGYCKWLVYEGKRKFESNAIFQRLAMLDFDFDALQRYYLQAGPGPRSIDAGRWAEDLVAVSERWGEQRS